MKFIIKENLDSGVRISLNRPDVRNAFHPQMIGELTQVAQEVSADPSVRFVLLEGEGAAFCAGADLSWMKSMVDYSYEENKKDAERLDLMFQAISEIPVPVITFGHGYIMGGALGILAVSDFVILDPGTKLCFSEVKVGLVPAVISPYILRRGQATPLSQLMMTGKMFGAAEAVSAGLADELVSANDRGKWLEDFKKNLSETAPGAVRATKSLLRSVLAESNASTKKRLTTETIAKVRTGPEGQEGLRSFLEKKIPSWRTP
jgi:methylglutaconyl-CoA hydratase